MSSGGALRGAPAITEKDHRTVYALPSSRVTSWNPGVPGGLPHYTRVHAAIPASAYGNGTNDARAGIQGALNAAGTAAVLIL